MQSSFTLNSALESGVYSYVKPNQPRNGVAVLCIIILAPEKSGGTVYNHFGFEMDCLYFL